jgi:hypothetical protein
VLFSSGRRNTQTIGFPTHSGGRQSVTVSFWGVSINFFILLYFDEIHFLMTFFA